jgi:predicted DsbA family dithiol-disulfide isomerase
LKKHIKIDVVSDIACPWCYIGKKRLENAIDLLKDQFEFNVTFQPFQLDPNIPVAGVELLDYFENKFGSMERAMSLIGNVEKVAKEEGLNFTILDTPKIPNTMYLHMILENLQLSKIQNDVAKRFFECYFEKAIDLSNIESIIDVMSEFGWDRDKTLSVLENQNLKNIIKSKIHNFQKLGVSGVPFFIVNDTFGISGAQTTDVFVEAFNSLEFDTTSNKVNETCDIDDKNC